ncbi:MAG TPA: hypothetical protein VET87_13460 [Rubrivivax sp.]|nr:hypothetical protein [Rubrivivax sp.]
MLQIAPYGRWTSPLGAERAVAAGMALSDVGFDGDSMLWQESRPAENGRNVVMRRAADGTLHERNPPPFNARTRVHWPAAATKRCSGRNGRPTGGLHFISDRSGWWNLYRWGEYGAEAPCPMQAEFGSPSGTSACAPMRSPR